jgi:hypothetical protein
LEASLSGSSANMALTKTANNCENLPGKDAKKEKFFIRTSFIPQPFWQVDRPIK